MGAVIGLIKFCSVLYIENCRATDNVYTRLISICKFVTMPKCLHGKSISQCFLKWFQYEMNKCFVLESKYAAPIHFSFTFRIEPKMKSFSHANNIVLRRVIYIRSLPGVKLVKLFSLANETWCAVTVPPFDFVKGVCAILDKKGYKISTKYNLQNLQI